MNRKAMEEDMENIDINSKNVKDILSFIQNKKKNEKLDLFSGNDSMKDFERFKEYSSILNDINELRVLTKKLTDDH
ncbi:hypothetical protein SNEBB_000117 [Seison nebaliae]|nr:hypothetical protein SNEBB_000117 [Seison nebaliae]